MTALAFVLLAGAAAVARVTVSSRFNRESAVPWGTLLVNATGSLALGLLVSSSPGVVTAVGAGGLGTYTTFSKFAVEVGTLLREGSIGPAACYVALSGGVCVGAAWLGVALATG